jgi:hypothetical protein
VYLGESDSVVRYQLVEREDQTRASDLSGVPAAAVLLTDRPSLLKAPLAAEFGRRQGTAP